MSTMQEHTDGCVYYIRLKTPKGIFYKIGFTGMESVKARFSYAGSEDYKMIDKIFMFKYSPYAYEIEQKLHSYLRPHRAYNGYGLRYLFSNMKKHPLHGNGQTELYSSDVLGLDKGYIEPKKFTFWFRKKTKTTNLVAERCLDVSFYHESTRYREEQNIYNLLDNFISGSLIYNQSDFLVDNGHWVKAINSWARDNAMSGIYGFTVHRQKTLPTTKTGLLALNVFQPKWMWITSLPEELKYLINLESVIVHSSSLHILPEGLFELLNLRVLSLGGSPIISNRIKYLSNLEVLDLQHSESLTSFPKEIELLSNLKALHVSPEMLSTVKHQLPNVATLITAEIYRTKMPKWFNDEKNEWVDPNC